MRRRDVLLVGAAAAMRYGAAEAQTAGSVAVLYAGSLVNLMERGIGPAFQQAGRGRPQFYAGGSNKLANEIRGRLRRGDVFISANPAVNDSLVGAANGDWVSWYVGFAQSPLVLGTLPQSRFAAALRSRPWFEVLQEPGVRIGRTDPKLDPKGKLTVDLLARAEQLYRLPDLQRRVLGAPDNPAQVLPEESLVGRLQSGQLDVGFFYSTETTDLHLAATPLPAEVALSAHYTATVLHDAVNPAGGGDFIAFLLGPRGRAIMQQHGLDVMAPTLSGDPDMVPAAIRSVIAATR